MSIKFVSDFWYLDRFLRYSRSKSEVVQNRPNFRLFCTWPILNIFIRSGNIRRRTLKSTEIGPNFACFWPINFFERTYDHGAKFRGDRPTQLVDLSAGKKRKKRQQNISLLRKLSFPGGLIT